MVDYTKKPLTLRKGKVLKRPSYDAQGNKVLERGRTWYRAVTPEGTVVEFDKKVKKTNRRQNNPNFANNPKARTNGFDKNPQNIYTGNVGQKIVKERKRMAQDGTLWRVNQRECLRRMLVMTTSEIYAHMIAWGQITQKQVLDSYGLTIGQAQIDAVGTEEPTMIQLSCITMIQHAQENPKFGLTILELLEGKAVSLSSIEEKEQKRIESAKQTSETENELDQLLDTLKSDIFRDRNNEESTLSQPKLSNETNESNISNNTNESNLSDLSNISDKTDLPSTNDADAYKEAVTDYPSTQNDVEELDTVDELDVNFDASEYTEEDDFSIDLEDYRTEKEDALEKSVSNFSRSYHDSSFKSETQTTGKKNEEISPLSDFIRLKD